jgi:hippurate hydrolase
MPLDFADTLRSWRHHLHANPELSLRESATAAFVCSELAKLGIAHEAGVGGHGVVATLRRGASNRAVGLRADMDALPIEETSGLDYASKNSGVMHACGHDGHTASLLGAALLLQRDEGWSGTIHFVFQPAEEGFGGADAMLRDGLLSRFPMERIFGYHNWPGLETGTVMLHRGPIMAAAANFRIALRGVAGHAAMPHLTLDPVQGAAHLIIALNSIVARNLNPLQPGVISTTTLRAAEANNQIGECATIGGTFRALTPDVMQQLESRIRSLAEHTARGFGLSAEVTIHGYLPPTINDDDAADLAADAISNAGLELRRDLPPTMGAEDFGRFLQEIPGAYAWIGNGASSFLHNPNYDYNDDLLPVAANYYITVAKAALA